MNPQTEYEIDAALAEFGLDEPPEWIDLAADIRAVDGNHDLGAGALAAALTARGWTRAVRPRGKPHRRSMGPDYIHSDDDGC